MPDYGLDLPAQFARLDFDTLPETFNEFDQGLHWVALDEVCPVGKFADIVRMRIWTDYHFSECPHSLACALQLVTAGQRIPVFGRVNPKTLIMSETAKSFHLHPLLVRAHSACMHARTHTRLCPTRHPLEPVRARSTGRHSPEPHFAAVFRASRGADSGAGAAAEAHAQLTPLIYRPGVVCTWE